MENLSDILLAILVLLVGIWNKDKLELLKSELGRSIEEYKGEIFRTNQDYLRREKNRFDYVQKQIEELYSPLVGLIQVSKNVHDIAVRKQAAQASGEVRRYFVENYLIPINKEIAQLIQSKIHLIEGEELPESFGVFLEHQTYYMVLHRLWKKEGQESDDVNGPKWPTDFENDARRTLKELRKRYQEHRRNIEQ